MGFIYFLPFFLGGAGVAGAVGFNLTGEEILCLVLNVKVLT